MDKLIISYILSSGQELEKVTANKSKDAAFIESLEPGKERCINGTKYKISKTNYSNDGKKLIVELELPFPWVGRISGIDKN